MSKGRVLLDASALLALLNDEPGAAEVQARIGKSYISSVNVAEVAGKLADHGMTDVAIRKVLAIGFDTVSFGPDEVAVMGKTRRATRKYGLSLGDRCCLATAMVQKCPVLTADNVWAKVKIRGLKIVVIGSRVRSR